MTKVCSRVETKRNDNASQVEPTPAATTLPTGLITRTVAKTAMTGATPLSDYVFLLVLLALNDDEIYSDLDSPLYFY
jgi:hypothetical protein